MMLGVSRGGDAERWSQSEQPQDRCMRCIIKEAKGYEIDVGLVEIEYPNWQFLNWAAIEVKSKERGEGGNNSSPSCREHPYPPKSPKEWTSKVV